MKFGEINKILSKHWRKRFMPRTSEVTDGQKKCTLS